MKPWLRHGLWLVAFVLFMASAWALCRSDGDCRAVSCPTEQGTVPLCNPNTKACYCGPVSCGNYACEKNETFKNCPLDCQAASCGNGLCDGTETSTTCPGDCKPVCGNSACEEGESTLTCPGDCAKTARCCQWITDAYGGKTGCAQYCADCGNLSCEKELGEDFISCPVDCQVPSCGDGVCDAKPGEDYNTCPNDCQEAKCESDIQCVGVGGCDYVTGQDYPAEGETVFNVCTCTAGACEIPRPIAPATAAPARSPTW